VFQEPIPKAAKRRRAHDSDRAGNAGAASPMRVLLAEDTPISADLMGAMAEHLGVELDIAANGAEAIAMIRSAARTERPYDLLLLDVMMPVLDGVETTRRLRGAGFDASALPIIAVTAATDLDEVRSYREAGMQAFLSKPVRLADLDSALNAWGNGAHSRKGAKVPAEWSVFRDQFAKRKIKARDQIEQALCATGLDDDEIMSLRAMLHQLAGTAGSFGENKLSERARAHEAALVAAHLHNGDVRAVLLEARESLEDKQ
jgi:CheY-like chemotaxis protein